MPEWGEIFALLIGIAGVVYSGYRIKGAQDVKITSLSEQVEKSEEDLTGKIDVQKDRIDNRVHVNDFKSHQTLMNTNFEYIKESLKRIEAK